jgi:hypothetical protein
MQLPRYHARAPLVRVHGRQCTAAARANEVPCNKLPLQAKRRPSEKPERRPSNVPPARRASNVAAQRPEQAPARPAPAPAVVGSKLSDSHTIMVGVCRDGHTWSRAYLRGVQDGPETFEYADGSNAFFVWTNGSQISYSVIDPANPEHIAFLQAARQRGHQGFGFPS